MAGCRYPNIDASAFKRGRYTGHAHGVWTIARYASGPIAWRAVHRDEPQHFPTVYGRTLGEISDKLLKINTPRYAR